MPILVIVESPAKCKKIEDIWDEDTDALQALDTFEVWLMD